MSKLTNVGISNIFTMGVAAKHDARQRVPPGYEIPGDEVRLCRARLILEEALETIQGLGFQVLHQASEPRPVDMETVVFRDHYHPDLVDIIDGCCDVVYVAVGTMLACGAADGPHLDAVCAANDAKFPGGVAITNENGKFQKPVGWQPPDHLSIIKGLDFDLAAHTVNILAMKK